MSGPGALGSRIVINAALTKSFVTIALKLVTNVYKRDQ